MQNGRFQKTILTRISTVGQSTTQVWFENLYRHFVKQNVLTCPPTGYGNSLPNQCWLSLLLVKEGYRHRFSHQSSSGSQINGQPYHVCCGSAGQVVSSRDPFHVTPVYRSPPPATWLVEISWSERKWNAPLTQILSGSPTAIFLLRTEIRHIIEAKHLACSHGL